MYNHYNPQLREYAHELRTLSVSKAEKYLWKAALRKSQLGVKFKCQRPIDRFIVDFFCAELKLIIEIDGSSHFARPEYDAYRQKRLKRLGYQIIRFQEGQVLNQYADVHMQLMHVVNVLKELDHSPSTSTSSVQSLTPSRCSFHLIRYGSPRREIILPTPEGEEMWSLRVAGNINRLRK